MNNNNVDFYELLEISPNANADTIDRVFRYLAQRYHPDNGDTGDASRFAGIVKAHEVLRDPEKRVAYDLHYNNLLKSRWEIKGEASSFYNSTNDAIIQDRILSVLYVKRRRNIHNPGIGNMELMRLVECPQEHIDFHLWYLKEKGWICRLENGLLAITVDGIDHVAASSTDEQKLSRLLTDQSH
ncbi:DnaJ domain-containing protein [Methylomarinum sp. Ch1-1]|uniref:DnaJ domain-containing protein n=1 Tax=Methylomarinum roseum TaxID=3067653 RepID=A0AAU7NZM3_9GAMM|nr:J domain-containing protein [Methylomarinum sp. Ch1-1]MDP4521409.1 DnaJ domain-containing protein [Methylomarinum sp. Ch1-1]